MRTEDSKVSWLPYANIALVVVFIGAVWVQADLPVVPILEGLLGVALAAYSAVIVHSLGAAIATVLVGYELSSIQLWPIELSQSEGSWRFRLSLRAFGSVGSMPRGEQHHRLRTALLAFAGPAASLSFALFAYHYAPFQGLPGPSHSLMWKLNLLAGVCSLLPGGGLAGIWSLIRPEVGEKLKDLAVIQSASAQGTRPRDLDSERILRLAANPERSSWSRAGQAFYYNWLLENHRLDEAEEVLLRLAEWTSKGREKAVWQLECVWFFGRFRNDPLKAVEWLAVARAEGDWPQGFSGPRAEAIVAFLQGQIDEAEKLARAAYEISERESDRGLRIGLLDEIGDLRRDIQAART